MFSEVSVKILVHFLIRLTVFLVLNFKSSLDILDNSPLSDVSFANIFSKSVVCLLILLTLSFAGQKFLISIKSSMSILFFMDGAFGVVPKKSSPYPRSSRFYPILSPRSFKVLHFTFRSTIYFELIFVKGISPVPRSSVFCLWMFNCANTVY